MQLRSDFEDGKAQEHHLQMCGVAKEGDWEMRTTPYSRSVYLLDLEGYGVLGQGQSGAPVI